jgi:DNA-directed RNA polymerase specialized sigma subunit
LVFEFEKDDATGFYLGHIVPQRQANSSTPYNVEQLMLVYEPMINRLVVQMAKTTPKAERRSIAMAALCEAVEHYDDGLGDLEPYIQSYLQRSLITENRQYTESFRNISFDAPLRSVHDGVFSLSHMISDQHSGGITQAETRIMANQFQNMLSTKEQQLVQLMQEDLKLPQIALELELTQEEVIELGRRIGEKRKAFYTVA